MSTDDDTPVGRVAAAYDRLIGRFVTWAEAEPDVRAAFVVGSRARVDTPADEWSDLDLVIVMTDPNRLLRRSEWLRNLGTVWVTYLEPTAVGAGMERRVLFEGGLDVDFVPTPLDLTTQIAEHGWPSDLVAVARRGIRFVLDKDGLASRLPALPEAPRAVAPSEDQYASTVDDFWYHTVWVAKKLRRGELWTAKMGCDGLPEGSDPSHGGVARRSRQRLDARHLARGPLLGPVGRSASHRFPARCVRTLRPARRRTRARRDHAAVQMARR
jgi:hypothetical protein